MEHPSRRFHLLNIRVPVAGSSLELEASNLPLGDLPELGLTSRHGIPSFATRIVRAALGPSVEIGGLSTLNPKRIEC